MRNAPKLIPDIYDDFLRRRHALITALTDGMYDIEEYRIMFEGIWN